MNQKNQSIQLHLDRRQISCFLTTLVLFTLVLKLTVAYCLIHYFDISYYVGWSTGVVNDFFGAYNNIENLDYPPLFLFPLSLTGKLLGIETIASFEPFRMLVLKGWQVLFDVACIPLFYRVFRRWGEWFGLMGAVIWAVNPTMLVNASYWGQTDSIMIFLLVSAFFLLEERHPVWSGVVMTLACLMKFQSLYFAPVFAIALLSSFPLKKILQTIAAGITTAAAVFLPFMARSGWKLPLEVYFGGFGQYQAATLNAFNFYFLLGLNDKPLDTPLPVSGLKAETFSMLVIILSLVLLAYLWYTASEKSVWLLGFLFMQNIFLFTTRMHERYQIPALAMLLAAALCHRSKELFTGFLGLTAVSFLNHFMLIEKILADEANGWIPHFAAIGRVVSMMNLILYVVTLVGAIHIFYRHGHHKIRDLFPALRNRKLPPPIPDANENPS